MDKDLTARRQQAEEVFNNLKNLKEEIVNKLNSVGASSVADIEAELIRLQGEARVLDELLAKDVDPNPVSPEPDVIDVEAAVNEEKGEE